MAHIPATAPAGVQPDAALSLEAMMPSRLDRPMLAGNATRTPYGSGRGPPQTPAELCTFTEIICEVLP